MSDQIRASHILISHAEARGAASKLAKEDALEKINQLKIEIEGGIEFAQAAQDHSDCPSSGNGGDLGEFGRGAMVPAFEEAAFGLETGAVSDAVETEFGFHLIQRTE